mmetsp:Transcript_7398/g.12703  ORF Transcript_7398/g.12703 Transcript_7398/m.12703 type:complete len:208 (-) Transcript_7398:202-825(-)
MQLRKVSEVQGQGVLGSHQVRLQLRHVRISATHVPVEGINPQEFAGHQGDRMAHDVVHAVLGEAGLLDVRGRQDIAHADARHDGLPAHLHAFHLGGNGLVAKTVFGLVVGFTRLLDVSRPDVLQHLFLHLDPPGGRLHIVRRSTQVFLKRGKGPIHYLVVHQSVHSKADKEIRHHGRNSTHGFVPLIIQNQLGKLRGKGLEHLLVPV